MNQPGMTPPTVEIIPGNNTDRGDAVVDGKMKVPVGMMIMYIIFYYYANDLPKPTIKLNLTSQETLGKVYQDMLTAKVATKAAYEANEAAVAAERAAERATEGSAA